MASSSKRTLLEAEVEEAQSCSKKGRRLRRYRTEEEVQKVRNTIFKDWSREDVHLATVKDMCLWDRLMADRRANRTGETKQSFGAIYYAKLKSEFKKKGDPKDDLEQFKNDGDSVDSALMAAIIPALKYITECDAISAYLRNNYQCPTCAEAVGIFQWSLSLSPRCANKRALCLDVLRWASRFKVQDKFPEMIQVMHAWIDLSCWRPTLPREKTVWM